MSGASFRVELIETEAALAELGGYVARARDPQGLFEQIGMSLVTSTQHRFETSVAPTGSPWPPSLRVQHEGGLTLVLTARLMRSISYVAKATGVEVGSNVVYAAIHQFGGDIHQQPRTAVLHFKTNKRTGQSRFAPPSKADRARKAEIGARTVHMPARPFLGLDDEDTREILRLADDWIGGEQTGAPQ
ncbi:phage virion morphogenesis protein [Rhodopseudomonas palustris]|uniref:Phage virion morphogenesis protein n=1 Tax=Rhodopseudomonas palustris TaxID=1076 RepID=A0A418V428_RHOPL|nr:phage virion morphogenesis protein [Rhodopseudomonas palustris]RJF70870.1 phage virion morphogenesis protein [Rhodopseudomonas palustris]